MPVRVSGADPRLYRRLRFGDLAELSMLDLRSYRSAQVHFGSGVRAVDDPARTITGAEQMAWLTAGISSSPTRWQLVGNWTHNDAETTADEPRLRRPEEIANAGFLFVSASGRLRAMANYRLSRDSIDVGNIALEDYAVLDFSLAYAFNETLELFGRLENAANEDYQELVGYNTPDRTAYGGIRFRF